MRLKILRIITVILFLMLLGNFFYLQILKGEYFYRLSVNNRIRIVPLEGPRGLIRDRNGIILADNRVAFHVSVIPQDVKDKESDPLFDFLSQTLSIEKKILQQRFKEKRLAPFVPVVIAEDIDKEDAMVLEENEYRFPGLHVQKAFQRQYPFKDATAHVLGYVGKITRSKIERLKAYGYTPQSVVGYSGVEEFYDQYLRAHEGGLQIEVNNRGQQVRLLSLKEPKAGEEVQLTIDHQMQQIATQVMSNHPGAVIVMNLDSGEILGLTSSPTFDANIFTDGRLRKQKVTIVKDEHSPLLNRAIKGMYPPGSIFKIVVTLAGLTTKKLQASSSFNCPGYYQLGKRPFKCAHIHGLQNLLEAIMHSCNVYFFNAGVLLGPELMSQYAHLLGLGSLTQVDLPFEEKGSIPSPLERKMRRHQDWYKGDTLNYSIGQGDVLVTPLQMVRMMATVALDGREVQPHVIQNIGSMPLVKLSAVRSLPIDEKIFKMIQSGLRSVVHDSTGTAHILDLPGLDIAGKTGTAQSVPGKESHAWFVGYNLSGKNRVVFCVFLEHGGSSYNACVIAKDLLLKMKEKGII
ncbi:MAG: penicillin-binding protein 2 [Candidatus Omnitrophica bacterium]|nr:penicillin-binding protein 2 [Candidatus Omnitrophota bacterium]